MTTSINQLVTSIVAALRSNGPATRDQLRDSLPYPAVDMYPEILGRALQKAKNDGEIEYSKVDGDRRCYWRLVERNPVQKVGPEMAVRIMDAAAGNQRKSAVDQAHEQGFEDGQQHAFQIVADRLRGQAGGIRALIADWPNGEARWQQQRDADQLDLMAHEIESGAWADTEPRDEP